MKYSKLNFGAGVIMSAALAITVTACNNNTQSSKESTAKNDTANVNAATTSETPNPVPKKKGKANVAMSSEMSVTTKTKMAKDRMGYYNYTEMAPAYPGGPSALDTYINSNIEYPQNAIDNNVEGTVNIQFAIDENGKVTNAREIGNKLGYGLDEEALQVISKMPNWSPGKVNGKNVKTWHTIPITYKIEES